MTTFADVFRDFGKWSTSDLPTVNENPDVQLVIDEVNKSTAPGSVAGTKVTDVETFAKFVGELKIRGTPPFGDEAKLKTLLFNPQKEEFAKGTSTYSIDPTTSLQQFKTGLISLELGAKPSNSADEYNLDNLYKSSGSSVPAVSGPITLEAAIKASILPYTPGTLNDGTTTVDRNVVTEFKSFIDNYANNASESDKFHPTTAGGDRYEPTWRNDVKMYLFTKDNADKRLDQSDNFNKGKTYLDAAKSDELIELYWAKLYKKIQTLLTNALKNHNIVPTQIKPTMTQIEKMQAAWTAFVTLAKSTQNIYN
jgi:hypothetical protein